MCLVVAALGVSADWPVVLVANRDEAFDRPTQPLTRQPSAPGPDGVAPVWLGGRDLRASGTWMGAAANGRVAVVTNVRRAARAEAGANQSRGTLATDWLMARAAPWQRAPASVGGCNLLLHTPGVGWEHASNCLADGTVATGWQRLRLEPGMHSMSNGHWSERWPKQHELIHTVTQALQQPAAQRLTALQRALRSQRQPQDWQLPHTGVPWSAERRLAPVFVQWPERGYGTRSSAVLWTTAAQPHTWRMCEWQHTPEGATAAPRQRALRWR
jgi:uncharacterized protein with NRDE domain